jgi:hypothetical protein
MDIRNFSCLEFLVTGIIVFVILLIPIAPAIHYDTTSAGEHTGFVTAVQQEGFFFHNYKVFFKTDNQSSQEDTYCVQEWDKSLADNLRTANTSRQLITIHYEGVKGLGYNLCGYQRIMDFK